MSFSSVKLRCKAWKPHNDDHPLPHNKVLLTRLWSSTPKLELTYKIRNKKSRKFLINFYNSMIHQTKCRIMVPRKSPITSSFIHKMAFYWQKFPRKVSLLLTDPQNHFLLQIVLIKSFPNKLQLLFDQSTKWISTPKSA